MALAPTRVVLPNGLTVIVKPNPTIPAVSLLVAIRSGAYADPAGAEGTSMLMTRLLDRGTVSRPADVIADALEGRGAALAWSVGRHRTAANATCLAEHVDVVIGLVADMLRHPAFPDDEVATRRAELVTDLRQAEDDPASRAVDACVDVAYAGHPYARRISGTVASVERLQRADLAALHAATARPASTIVAVAGDIDAPRAVDMVTRHFADWAAPAVAEPAVPDAVGPATRSLGAVPMMHKAQTDVAYGFVGVRRADPDYDAIVVMNNALGQYAIGGRLGDSIRERQGMAYYVFSSLDAGLGAGPLLIRAGVAPENVERTIASIDAELEAIRRNGFTRTEVEESVQYLVGSLPRQLETNAAIAGFLVNAELFGLGLDYDERLPGLLARVTLDAANAAARRLLEPARAVIVVAGPWRMEPVP